MSLRPPRVSIAMPFRNAEKTLAMAIRSVLGQTFEDFELLLCDDKSTDQSLEIAGSFQDPRIVLSSDGHHKALAGRLNECIGKARGEYLVRMDADDICYPERIAKQVDFLDDHAEVDVVSAFALVFGAAGKPIGKLSGPTKHAQITGRPLMGFRMWHPTWAGRTAWFQKHGYRSDAVLAQDQELLFRAYRVSRYAAIPEILLGYRQEELRLRKMIRYRLSWWRYMGWHLRGISGFFQRIEVALILAAKVSLDALAMVSGLKYRILRRRARPLQVEEIVAWNQLWQHLSAASPVESARLVNRG